MDKIKKIVLCAIPTSICNLRCRYCYLSQRNESYGGEQAHFLYSPRYVGRAFSKQRMGGSCYFNFCADGETLLTKGIEQYIYEILQQGHYAEIVSNMTVTPVIDRILSWDRDLIRRITFKCSFHYLQLLERNLLQTFSDNVNKVWNKGCSANIEITPDDELIPYIDEVKEFSIKHFGALPHLSIARNDNEEHDYLTNLPIEEYDQIWSQFDSGFWEFKKTIFNQKRCEVCYAGSWSIYVNLATGNTVQCYKSRYSQNIFKNINKPIDFIPICKCMDSHCYNGHILLTLGCIPEFTGTKYGDIRDREKIDGSHWIQPQMKNFLNTKLEDSNKLISDKEIVVNERKMIINQCINRCKSFIKKL